jgi:hypothetical protein
MSEFFPTILSTNYEMGKEKTEPVVELECPICMDTVDRKINCVITECGHAFHSRCLLTNVLHNGFGCPYCRSVLIDSKLLEEEDEDDNEENTTRRRDDLNTAFFLDDEEDDADSWNPEDGDDEEDEEEGHDENQENPVINNALRGMRLMFANAEGDDDIDVSESEEEEDDDENSGSDSGSIESEQETSSNRNRHHTDDVVDELLSGARLTPIEIEREDIRLLHGVLPNMSYILRRFTSSAYNDLTYEEICCCLLRIILWRDFPRTYGTIIRTSVVHRLDYNVGLIINQIIEGYQVYDHDAYIEDRRQRDAISQASDMGMD